MNNQNKAKECSVEGCNKPVRKEGKCWKHSESKGPICKVEGCEQQAKQGGLCIKHGAKIPKCTVEGCDKGAVQGGLCVKHGAKIPKCTVEGCNNNSQGGGLCFKHGAKVILCKVDGCTNRRQTCGLCFKHGAKVTLCKVEGCEQQVKQGGLCVKHGARSKPCEVCNFYTYTKRKVEAEGIFVRMCAGCFYHTYPNETVPRRYLKKQNFINEKLKDTFGADFFITDKAIECGCSKRRPDWFRDCHKFCIIIECDEEQHKREELICENKRMMSIFKDLGERPLVIIRFNPDKYKTDTGFVKGCFKFRNDNAILCTTTEFEQRYKKLKDTIQYYLDNGSTKDVEEIKLYYDC